MDLQKEYTTKTDRKTNKIVYSKICTYCAKQFKTNRIDKITCCEKCRQAHYRRMQKGLQPLASPVKSKDAKKTD
jgi:hypothetical protein